MTRGLAIMLIGLALAGCSKRDVKEFALDMRVRAEGAGAKAAEERAFRPEIDPGLAQGPIQAPQAERTPSQIQAAADEKAAIAGASAPNQGQVIYYPVQ